MSFVAIVDTGSLTPAAIERDGQGVFVVKDPIVITVGHHPFIIPTGFATDGASIPFWARWIFNAWGRSGIPAVLHDFIRERTELPKWTADLVFFMVLRAFGVPELKASLMYFAVRTHKPTKKPQAAFQSGAHSLRMADPLNPTPGLISQTLAKAAVQWRQLVGLLPSFWAWLKTLWANPWFDKPLPKLGFPNISRATWDEIRDIAQSLPLTLLKLIICGGLVLNVTRALIETNIGPKYSADGMMRFDLSFPDRDGWYWLAALWLVSITVEKVVKVVITVRASA